MFYDTYGNFSILETIGNLNLEKKKIITFIIIKIKELMVFMNRYNKCVSLDLNIFIE